MSLRVRGPSPQGSEIRRGQMGGAPPMDDGYMSRLVKLVPAEAIGPFPFLLESAKNVPMPDGSARLPVYFVAWTLLLIVVVLRYKATSEPGKGAQWGGVLIAAVAFFIWAHVMGGDFGFELLFNKMASGTGADGISRATGAVPTATGGAELKNFLANVSLMAWTTLAPVIYRGEEDPG